MVVAAYELHVVIFLARPEKHVVWDPLLIQFATCTRNNLSLCPAPSVSHMKIPPSPWDFSHFTLFFFLNRACWCSACSYASTKVKSHNLQLTLGDQLVSSTQWLPFSKTCRVMQICIVNLTEVGPKHRKAKVCVSDIPKGLSADGLVHRWDPVNGSHFSGNVPPKGIWLGMPLLPPPPLPSLLHFASCPPL